MIKNIEERRYYQKIHCWLRYHYRKANHCDNPECPKTCKYFSWALKKGKELEKNRDNFIQLCYSCHTKYDFTEERKKHLSKIMKGKPASPQAYTALKKKLTGVPKTDEYKENMRMVLRRKWVKIRQAKALEEIKHQNILRN